MPDDLDWKRDKMRRVAAQASEYAKSAATQVQPTPMPSNADALMAQYGGQGLPPANGGDPSGTYGPVAQGKPDLQGSSLTGNNPSTATDPESVPGTAIEAGAAESIHAAGDIASAAPAPMLYAGRKVGKGIVSAMGGQLPAQQQSDRAGLWGDITSPFTRGYARATGDFSQAPNERQGLTSSTMGEIGEAGGLALDPNASWGERALGGLGAVAGAGAMLLSGKGVGGLPEGLDPGLAVSSRIDRANLARLAAGRGTIPNPTLGELFAGATKELPKPSGNRIGFDRRGALGNLEPSDADLSKEEFLKQAQRKRQVEELQKRLGEKFAPPPAPGEQPAAAAPPPAPAASPAQSLIEEAKTLNETLYPEAHNDVDAFVAKLSTSDKNDVKAVAESLNIGGTKSRKDAVTKIKDHYYSSIGNLGQGLSIESGAGTSAAKDAAAIQQLTEDKKAAALAKRATMKAEAGDPAMAKLTEEPAAPASVPANNKPVMAGFPKVDGVAEVRKSPDFASTGERLVKLDNGEVHPIYYDKSTGGYYHTNHVNDDAQRGFIAFDKKEVLERLVGTKGYREYTPNNSAMAKLTETPKPTPEALPEQPAAPPEAAPAEVPPPAQEAPANVPPQSSMEVPGGQIPSQGQGQAQTQANAQGGQGLLGSPPANFTSDTGVPAYTEGYTASVGPSKYFKGYGNKPGIANQPGYVEPKPPVEPTINPTVEDVGVNADTGSYTGYAGNDNPKGRIQDTVQTPAGEEVGGFGGPQRWRLRRAKSPAVKADVNQPALYPKEGPGPWGPDQQPVNKPIHGPGRDDRPFYGPGGEGVEQGPGPFGPEQGPANQPPLQGPGPWGEANGPERRPKNLPTPWVPNKYFANKFGSLFSTKLTGVLNSDNQLERLERIGAEAARQAKNYPGRFSPEQLDAINAIHETVERVKNANNKTVQWYKEIGPALEDATSQLLGPRYKRSAEALDLKQYLHPKDANGNVTDPRVQYSKMTALVDDTVRNQFPGVAPLNAKQAAYIDTVKDAMGFSSAKSAESGMLTTGPGGKQYWRGEDGISRMLRNMPAETKYLMENDANFRDKALRIILAQPGNEDVKLADAIAEFTHGYSTPEKQSALEHLRVIKNMPDRIYVEGQTGGKWYQFNDFVDHAVPTKGYHGSGIGGVIRGQLQRAAIVDEFGTRGAGPGFKDLIEGTQPGESLLNRVSSLGKDVGGVTGKEEVQTLMAAASGKRSEAGFLNWKIPEGLRQNPLYQVGVGVVNMAKDVATSGVWMKDFMRPAYQAAMDYPGGPLAKLTEAGIVTAAQAKNLFGGLVNKVAGRGIGKYLSQPYQAKVAGAGHVIEDYTNGLNGMIPWAKGELSSMSTVEKFMARTGDLNPFKVAGQFMNDLVFGASEATTANSARRAADAYMQRAIRGAINEADYTKLANDGVSSRSIDWLKSIEGKFKGKGEAAAREMTANNATAAHELVDDLVSNTINRYNKQIGSPVYNQKLMNTPEVTKNIPFLNYDFTMQRAGEDTLKTTRSILSLDNLSSGEKASLIAKKIVNFGVKLGVIDASGEAVRALVNTITGRKETDWEKAAPYEISRIVSNLFATKVFGVGAMVADAAMEKLGLPRPWSKVGGKETKAHMPAENAFAVEAAQKMMAIPAAAGRAGLKEMGAPVKGSTDVLKAVKDVGAGPLGRAVLPADQKAGGGGGVPMPGLNRGGGGAVAMPGLKGGRGQAMPGLKGGGGSVPMPGLRRK